MTPSNIRSADKATKTYRTPTSNSISTCRRSRCPSLLSSHALFAQRTFSSDDVIRSMLSYLPLRALLTASEVDTQWWRTSTKPELWKALLLRHFGSSLAPVINAVELQTAKDVTPRSHLSLHSSCSSSSHLSPSSHQSTLKRLFIKQYLDVHGACKKVEDGDAEEEEEEARWKRHFAFTYLQVQLWVMENNDGEEDVRKRKKRLLASESVCLADGDGLLQLFGDYGIHLRIEEDEKERGLDLEDYDAVASLQTTMTFLEVAQDGKDDVRIAKALLSTNYDLLSGDDDQVDDESGAFVPVYSLGEDHMLPYDVLQTGTCTLQHSIQLLMNNCGREEREKDVDSTGDDPSFSLHVHARISIVRFQEDFHCECGECERPVLEFYDTIMVWQHLAACLAGVRDWQ
ncbi:hypothetical protein VYU27_008497 [Nannochloropsis oceanica]